MKSFTRFLIFIILIACFLPGAAASTLPLDGIRILVMSEQGRDSWMVSEFIDNAILDNMAAETGEGVLEISPSLTGSDDTAITITFARSQPLLIFSAEHLNALEERLIEAERLKVESRLSRDLRGQIVSGLFQVPLWPYLAASEIPLRSIDIERSYRLPDYRPGSFPATSYTATGDVYKWVVVGMGTDSVSVEKTADTGVGTGVSIDYLVNGGMSDLQLTLDENSGLYALYINDGSRFTPEMQFSPVDVDKFIGALENPESAQIEGPLVSTMETNDDQGHIARMLIIPDSGAPGRISVEAASVTENPETKSGAGIGTTAAVLICWIGFGILVLVGNWLFPFSALRPIHLVSRAVALYPLYIILAMLTAGIWGMGFVIASAGVSRFLAPEGRRLAATGVVLAASFGITVISWLLVG